MSDGTLGVEKTYSVWKVRTFLVLYKINKTSKCSLHRNIYTKFEHNIEMKREFKVAPTASYIKFFAISLIDLLVTTTSFSQSVWVSWFRVSRTSVSVPRFLTYTMRARFAVFGVFGISRSLNSDGLLGVGYRTSFRATGVSGVTSKLCLPLLDGPGEDCLPCSWWLCKKLQVISSNDQ